MRGYSSRPPQRQQIINLIAGWTVAGINGAVTALTTVEDDLAGIALQFVQAFNSSGNNVFSQMKEPFTTLTTGVLNEAFLALVQGGESTPDNAVATATAAMGEAFGFGLASAATSAFFEACLPEKLNVLNGAGPMLAKMAGFDEIAAAVRDPLYENAFGKSLDYHFRSIFKPELPSEVPGRPTGTRAGTSLTTSCARCLVTPVSSRSGKSHSSTPPTPRSSRARSRRSTKTYPSTLRK